MRMSKEGFFWCQLWYGEVQNGLYPPARDEKVTHWAIRNHVKPEPSRLVQPTLMETARVNGSL